MKFNKELVDHYADLLLIGLTPSENELVLSEFNIIEDNMNIISNIPNISNIEPMTHPIDNNSIILADDVYEESLSYEEILCNSKCHTDKEIIVPKVVGE